MAVVVEGESAKTGKPHLPQQQGGAEANAGAPEPFEHDRDYEAIMRDFATGARRTPFTRQAEMTC